MKTQLITPDGTITDITPMNGETFQLQELYELLECSYIEIVNSIDGRLIICDEEGKLYNRAYNEKASDLYKHGCNPGHELVGKVLFCKPSQID
jgi:hypothetical protein